MGKTYETITTQLQDFIEKQSVFFVATAPLGSDGHLNLSPKGLDAFRVLGPTKVAYLELGGSGAETIAHLRENGRITIMFCAFSGTAKILRLYGGGRVVFPGDAEWDELVEHFEELPGARSIIVMECTRIGDACGFGVPRYEYQGERTQLCDWASRKGSEGLKEYMRTKNRHSIDGLPALEGTSRLD